MMPEEFTKQYSLPLTLRVNTDHGTIPIPHFSLLIILDLLMMLEHSYQGAVVG